jgi:hypothetical protein
MNSICLDSISYRFGHYEEDDPDKTAKMAAASIHIPTVLLLKKALEVFSFSSVNFFCLIPLDSYPSGDC